MGFYPKMVEELLNQDQQMIEDTNHAVELLIKGEDGWLHWYIDDLDIEDPKCKICSEP